MPLNGRHLSKKVLDFANVDDRVGYTTHEPSTGARRHRHAWLAGWGVFGGFDPVGAGWDSVLGYTGEVSDPASGVVSFYARTLDVTTGVFTGVDAWEGLPRLPTGITRRRHLRVGCSFSIRPAGDATES